jgi:signal transduction histidine kinase
MSESSSTGSQSGGTPRRTLQHAFNNPLTALMAELQLLQLEPDMPPTVIEATDRMLVLVRRLADMARQLGDIPERPDTP